MLVLQSGESIISDKRSVEFLLHGAEISLNSVNSANSRNLVNHCSMSWVKFNDPVSHICLAGAVVASWSCTREVAGSSSFTVNKYFCHCFQ